MSPEAVKVGILLPTREAVMSGRFDVAWSYCAKLWDVAAGLLLIREAGGLTTSFDGNDFPFERRAVHQLECLPAHRRRGQAAQRQRQTNRQ